MKTELDKLLALSVAHLPLPAGAEAIGPVSHPDSGLGGMLVLFRSGRYMIRQADSFRGIPQAFAGRCHCEMATKPKETAMPDLEYLARCRKEAATQEPKLTRYDDRPEDGPSVLELRQLWRESRDKKEEG